MLSTNESTLNGLESGNEGQRPQPPQNAVNGVVPMYPYPPPPGSVYPVGATPDMYQAIPGGPGSRMIAPMPYPFPPVQHGQPGHSGPYPFPAVMTQSTAGGASPTSPTGGQMQVPYPPYAMWYGPPGMAVPPPGSLPQNGMAPVPIPVGPYPPPGPHIYQAQSQGDAPPGETGQQQANGTQQNNSAPWVPGPGGLPPKEVARTIPCRYFPECRFGASCWFLHPGVDQSQANDDVHPPKPFLSGSMPPPVRYGPSGAWDPSGAAPQTNGVSPVSPDGGKAPYSPQGTAPNGAYGMMYAPYPYPPMNGYPSVYPPSQQQPSAPASSAPASAPPQSPQPTSQPMSPQHGAQSIQQHPSSQSHSPVVPTPPGAPNMYPVNGHPMGYYPSQFSYPQPPPTQASSAINLAPGLYQQVAQGRFSPVPANMTFTAPNGISDPSINSVGPPMGQTGAPIPLHMAPLPPAAHGGPIPVQAIPPGIPYPIPAPYSTAPPPLHSRSPSQSMHPHSPQNASMPPQSLYGQSPLQQSAPMLPPHGRHSRRESMSSMAAVPMGTLLGPNLDGNTGIDGSRSPPSAFREMDNGFGPNRRGRGHANRGSWSSNGFGSGRKPPCAFYPVGKCKNGDQCRFPHVMPDENSPVSPASPRGGHSGSFGRAANGRRPTILGPIEDKLAEMTVKEVCIILSGARFIIDRTSVD
ncbi:hypothetical protein FRC17_004647 [Serendipita sp. 399]|nr:hypothetical protein FRC17_004647 [Serendipita sp. 399]